MVESIYGGPAPSRNAAPPASTSFQPAHGPAATPPSAGLASVHPGIVDDPLLTPDDQCALLRHVDEEVLTTLGDLAALLPRHPRPVSAVLLMVQRGLLAIDTGSPFGPAALVCRAEPLDG